MKNMRSEWKKTCKGIVVATVKIALLVIAMMAAIVFIVAWSAPVG